MEHAILPNQAPALLKKALLGGVVPLLKGSPGIGKSDVIRQLAKSMKAKVIDLRLAQCDPTDLNGLPHFRNGKSYFAPFDVFPTTETELPEGCDCWILFLDELTSASKGVQSAAYKLILDRMVGQFPLHSKVYIIAAGNLTTDKAVVVQTSTALKSRMAHLNMKVDKKAWVQWALKNGIDNRIISFIEFRSDLLYNFNPSVDAETFASPRTWHFLSNMYKGMDITAADIPLVMGTVGVGAGAEFYAYTELMGELPTLNQIVKDPSNTQLPASNGSKYALIGMMANESKLETIEPLMEYLEKFSLEFTLVYLRMAFHTNRKLIANPTFSKTLRKFQKELKDFV